MLKKQSSFEKSTQMIFNVATMYLTCLLVCLTVACSESSPWGDTELNSPSTLNAIKNTSIPVDLKGYVVLPMEIVLPKRIVSGEPCEAKVVLTNSLNELVVGGCMGKREGIGIKLVNSKGKRVAATKYGVEHLIPDAGIDGSAGVIRIDPGQKHTWRIDVAKCFDLEPGTYTATIFLDMLHPGKEVKFEVFPAEM